MFSNLIYFLPIYNLSYLSIISFGVGIKCASALHVGHLNSRAVPNSQTPPSNALIVRQTGTQSGEFATLSSALSSLKGKTGSQFIFVYEGTYKESLIIDYPYSLKIQGHTTNPSSHTSNTVTLKNSRSAREAGNDAASSVIYAKGDDFAMYNINLENAYGVGTDSQAIALTTRGSRQAYHACKFTSYQDTLYVKSGSVYLEGCNIEGAVDFIFGSATAWFEGGTIAVKRAKSVATITANKRPSANDPTMFVFNKVSIVGIGAASRSAYLGRPWSSYAKVIFQSCNMSDVINSKGWIGWNPSDPRTENVQFSEYRNVGPGSGTQRMYAKQVTSNVLISNVLGKDYANWT